MSPLAWLRCLLGRGDACPNPDPTPELRARRLEREREELQRRLDRVNALAVRAAVEGRREERGRAN